MKKKIGIIGQNFGRVVEKEAAKEYNVCWIIGSEEDYMMQKEVDLVYIASPTEFHYEQAIFFLKNKVAVVLEKTPCLSVSAVKKLIYEAKKNNSYIYFSDLIRFRSDITKKLKNFSKITWTKNDDHEDWVLSRLGYHYLYLIAMSNDKDIIVQSANVTKDRTMINLILGTKEVYLDFEQNATENIHQIDNEFLGKSPSGSIQKMLTHKNLTHENINRNNEVTIKTIKIFNEIRKYMPHVAVVGGGIFGTTASIQLAKSGLQVTLFEKEDDLFKCASGINQYRVHRGYHYPRSRETASSCDKDSSLFKKTFSASIEDKHDAYYAIASENSFVGPEKYIDFLNKQDLKYEVVENFSNCALTIKVEEFLYNPSKLKKLILDRLYSLNVKISLNTDFLTEKNKKKFSCLIIATYSSSGIFDRKEYQFEVCEKPVVRLPKAYKGKSVVVMDGPFMCFDPFEDGDMHVLGNVEHAIHSRNIGISPKIPENIAGYLNRGIIESPKITNFPKFVETYKKFFKEYKNIEHVGSMYTIRTVLPNREHDDARPTIIEENASSEIQIFSGKVVNCVSAAREVTEISWKKILY